MANRRRSDRIAVSLPVWLKDGQGGERTLTANISTHGIAVFSPKPRALRQYMELELSLPSPRATISVTAMVTRLADLIKPDGQRTPGIGLDFFLFDAQAKANWQQYLRNLRDGPVIEEAPAAPSPLPVLEPEDDGETPTFIIKPRDLGRLWAFYRGELTKGVVRIETPVAKRVGSQVELLVVHPSSQSEWILAGAVARATPQTRMGRPVLEIGLVGLGSELRNSFRNFVASGRGMIEEDVSMSGPGPLFARPPTPPIHFRSQPPSLDEQMTSEVPDRFDPLPSERIPSVVVDLDAFEEVFSTPGTLSVPQLDGPEPVEVPVSFEIDLVSEPSLPIPTMLAQRPEPEAPVELPDSAIEPVRNVHLEEEPSFISIDDATSSPSIPIAVEVPPEPPLPESEPETRLEGEPEPEDSRAPTMIFASFFAEAAGRSEPPQPVDLDQWDDEQRLNGQPDAHGLPTVLSEAYTGPVPIAPRLTSMKVAPPPLPIVSDEPDSAIEEAQVLPSPEVLTGDLEVPSSLPSPPLAVLPPPPAPSQPWPELSGLHLMGRSGEPIPLRPKPVAVPVAPPTSAELPEVFRSLPETARPRHELKVVRGDLTFAPRITPVLPTTPAAPAEPEHQGGAKVTRTIVEQNVAQNPPRPPGTEFDFSADDDPAEHSADELPVKMPGNSVAARRAAVRQSVENQNSHHKNLSTAHGDPDLARDIALARARVVRSPHSVTACYRLSMLLVRDGQDHAFDEALDSLQKVLALEPNHPGAHHKLAEVLARRGRFEPAAEHLNKARRLGYRIDPDLEALIYKATQPNG